MTGKDFKGFEVVAQAARSPRELDYATGWGGSHCFEALEKVARPAIEIMTGKNEAGAGGSDLAGGIDHQSDFLAEIGRTLIGGKLDVDVGRRARG